MALRDFTNITEVVESIRPQTATGAVNGETIDMQGADSVLIAISAGAITGGNGDSSITLEESDDDSNWSDVADDDIIGTEPTLDPNTAYQFGYRGGSRYVRAVFDLGTETDAAIAAIGVKGHLHRDPHDQTFTS